MVAHQERASAAPGASVARGGAPLCRRQRPRPTATSGRVVPRPLTIEVEHQDIDGITRITTFERGMARLVYYEMDHLFGVLYRSRMKPEVEPISVSMYKGAGQ
jgi:Polypeptide deformylase